MELSNPTLECKPQTGWQRQSAQPRPTRTETSERSLHHSCSLGSCTQTHRKTRTHILITEPGKLMAKKTEKLLQRSLFWTQNATVVLKYFSTEEQVERYMHSVMDGSALLQTDSDRQLPVSLCILFTGITSTIYTQCSTMRQVRTQNRHYHYYHYQAYSNTKQTTPQAVRQAGAQVKNLIILTIIILV